jgi:hypothetical protein
MPYDTMCHPSGLGAVWNLRFSILVTIRPRSRTRSVDSESKQRRKDLDYPVSDMTVGRGQPPFVKEQPYVPSLKIGVDLIKYNSAY